MSRYYRVEIELSDLAEEGDEQERIITLMRKDYGLDTNAHGPCIVAHGDVTLCGGQGEQSWSEELAKEVWSVTKRPTDIQINWWYEERSPDETILLDETDFSEMFPALKQLAMTAEEESDGSVRCWRLRELEAKEKELEELKLFLESVRDWKKDCQTVATGWARWLKVEKKLFAPALEQLAEQAE
jgi:hypothetical protein